MLKPHSSTFGLLTLAALAGATLAQEPERPGTGESPAPRRAGEEREAYRRLAAARVQELLDRDLVAATAAYRELSQEDANAEGVRWLASQRLHELHWLAGQRDEPPPPRGGRGGRARMDLTRRWPELAARQAEIQQALAAQDEARLQQARTQLRDWLTRQDPPVESNPLLRMSLASIAGGGDEARESARRLASLRSFEVLRLRLEGKNQEADQLAERIWRGPGARRRNAEDPREPAMILTEAQERLAGMLQRPQAHARSERELLRRLAQRLDALAAEQRTGDAVALLDAIPWIGDLLLARSR